MNKPPPTQIIVNVSRANQETYLALQEYCKANDLARSATIWQAVRLLLEGQTLRRIIREELNLRVQTPDDDLLEFIGVKNESL